MQDRNYPVAVRENERRHQHWSIMRSGKRRLLGNQSFQAEKALKSEDLPPHILGAA